MEKQKKDFTKINGYIKEFLKFNRYNSTLDCFEAEERTKFVTKKAITTEINKVPSESQMEEFPRLYRFFDTDSDKTAREKRLDKEMKLLQSKHSSVLNSARQIFSIAINCLQHLHNLKDGNVSQDNLGESIENYKIQLGKYHKILLSEIKSEKSELFSETVMQEHKIKLIKAKDEKNVENIIEVLLSLRVNALQISPEQRRSLVAELIRNDIFQISKESDNNFVLDLLDINSHALKHAICALISVISSTPQGVDYLIQVDMEIIRRTIDILKEQEDGSVTQRFCIAILQKTSVKEEVIPILVEFGMIDWILALLTKSIKNEIHIFSRDFSSALLANILHCGTTLEKLEEDGDLTKEIMTKLLSLLKENIPSTVLMHILICLSYLSKERFSQQIEYCDFVNKISDFVEYYNSLSTTENDGNPEVDRKTVLDLCAHMFHPKDVSNDVSQTMEYNEMKCEDRIKEFENAEGDLIFECFQDEVS